MTSFAEAVLPLVAALITATPATAGEWPQFHGPNRDNKSADKGLLKRWPEGGPPRVWHATGIGEGYSTVAIAGKRIHTTGSINGDCVITALDMAGRKVWTRANGKAWARSYPGTRSTPTIRRTGCSTPSAASEAWCVSRPPTARSCGRSTSCAASAAGTSCGGWPSRRWSSMTR